VIRSLFKRIRPLDLDRELTELRAAHAGLPVESANERKALGILIRSRERLRRRLSAGLPAA